MSAIDIIRESLKKAQDDGLVILRGPVYYWEGDKLVGCDCFGAVMYAHGLHKNGLKDIQNDDPAYKEHKNPHLWINTLFKTIGKDAGWWSRFHFGFHHRKQLMIEIKKDDKKEISPCEISKKSWTISDEFKSVDIHDYLLKLANDKV